MEQVIYADPPVVERPSPLPPSQSLWEYVRAVVQARRFIVGATALAAVLAVVMSLLLPVWYYSSARVLLPTGGLTGGLSGLLGGSSLASSLLGGGGGDYTRYLAILTSRSVLENTVSTFDLVSAYGLGDSEHPEAAALKELREQIAFEVDLEFFYLEVGAFDQEPARAAEIANFMVAELNRINATLATEDAANYRRYVEGRYRQSLADMDTARIAMRRFQEERGVLELPMQAQGFLQTLASQRASALEAEIQYEALRNQLGPDNPQVQAAREVVRAADRAQAQLLSGSDALMPVALEALPEVASEYARLYQDILTQTAILEVVQPLYEQALFEEERDRVAVQVLDPATPPVRKAKPKRAIIVVVVTLSAFMLAIALVLARVWWRRMLPELRQRL